MAILLDFLHIIRFPCLVEELLFGTVEAEDDEVAFAGDGGDPVFLFTFGGLGAEVELVGAVWICDGLVHRVQRR
jgi:hypothetical protein